MCDSQLLIVLLTIFFSNTIYGLAAPFLPTVMEERGVDTTWTGLIFAMYAIAVILVSLVAGKTIDYFGHSRIIAFGSLLMAASIVGFGMVDKLHSQGLLIGVSLLLRALQGKQAAPSPARNNLSVCAWRRLGLWPHQHDRVLVRAPRISQADSE